MTKIVLFILTLMAALTAFSICEDLDPNDALSIMMAQLRVQKQHNDLLAQQIEQQREQLALLTDMVHHQFSIWRDVIGPVMSALCYSATVATLAIMYRKLRVRKVVENLEMPQIEARRESPVGLKLKRSQMSKLVDLESGYQRELDAGPSIEEYFSAAE